MSIPILPRCSHKAQIVARGDDAGIVYATGVAGEPGEQLTTCTLEGAFTSWPPRVGTPVQHLKIDLGNRPPQLVAWSHDEVVVWSGDPCVLGWNREGVQPFGVEGLVPDSPTTGRLGQRPNVIMLGPKREHGVFVYERVNGAPLKLLHHSAESPSVVTKLVVPAGAKHLVVLDDGGVLAVLVEPPKGNLLDDPTLFERVETVRLGATETERNAFDLPPGASVATVVRANGGGAWLACWSRQGEVVIRLDASGKPVGSPWRAPFGGLSSPELVAWRNGFVLFAFRRGIALLVSDGVHTTRVEGPPGGDGDVVGALHSLAISKDERAILLCHHTTHGLQVLRADFETASAGGSNVSPWEADRIAGAELAERLAARAEAPPPLPGRVIEMGEAGAPSERCRAKERIVSQARLRHVLSTISGLYFGEFARFQGNDDDGRFVYDDGCGNFVYLAWSAEGLIAIGFDHEANPDAGLDDDDLTPEKYFPELPAALASLLTRGVKETRRNATGGLWVTSGNAGRWNEEGSFPDEMQRYLALPEVAVFDAIPHQSWLELCSISEAQARLAIALAEKSARGPHTITPEEEHILLTPPDEDPRAEATHVTSAVAAFASIGITWADAEGRAAAFATAKLQSSLDALGSLQVELLRAADAGDVEAARSALDRGADIECVAADGLLETDHVAALAKMLGLTLTPLSIAAMRGRIDVVDLLLSRGAAIAAAREGGHRPPALYIAAVAGDATILARLLAHAPEVDVRRSSAGGAHRTHKAIKQPRRAMLSSQADVETLR